MKRVKIIVLVALILAIILMPMKVLADSFNLVATADKTYAKPGETVTISLKVANIDAGDLGINTLEGKLKYDTNIFEDVQQSDIKGDNNWSITYNGEDTEQNGKLVATTLQSGVKDDQIIGYITLKVKNNAKYTKTTITISDIASNNGKEIIKEDDKKIELEVGEKDDGSGNSNNTVNGNNTNNNGNNSNNGNNNSNGNNSNSGSNSGNSNSNGKKNNILVQGENMSSGKLPQTGVLGVSVSIITALIIYAVVMFLRYRNIDK